MASTLAELVIYLIVGLIVSSIIIYLVTKLFGEREGIETAVPTALVGAIIYALSFFFLGQGLFASIIAGFVWLAALVSMYDMSWLKAGATALVVWVAAALVSFVLPTVIGPL